MKHTEAPTRKKMGFYIRLWRPVGGLDKKDFSRAWKNTSCALFISTKTDRRSFRNGGFFEYHTLYIKWPASCMAHPGRQKRRRISAEKERFRYNIIESISNTLATNFSENPCKIKLFHFFSITPGYTKNSKFI